MKSLPNFIEAASVFERIRIAQFRIDSQIVVTLLPAHDVPFDWIQLRLMTFARP